MRTSRIDGFIAEQENIETVNRKTIEELQLCKLNRLLKREKGRKGFYSGLPEKLESLAELKELPFTSAEDLANNASGLLLCSQADIQRVLSDATSGTTGAAKRVFYTERDCENTIALFMAGLGEFIFPGSVTLVCMPFSGPYGLGELIAEAVCRLGARPIKAGAGKSYAFLQALIREEKPDTYVGMPVQLLGMLRFCGRGSLRRALVSGDACPAVVLGKCEEILGSRLFPHYGSREMGLGGAICCQAHEGMHLRENHVIAEIVDESGHVLPPGQYGELVITTIGMEAMPLIRYKTGDYTRIIPGSCPCGSQVIRLDSLRRKGEASLILSLDNALFELDGLIDYTARQQGDSISITASVTGRPSAAEIAERAEQVLKGCRLSVSLRTARPDDLPLYPGKRSILRSAEL